MNTKQILKTKIIIIIIVINHVIHGTILVTFFSYQNDRNKFLLFLAIMSFF